MLLLGGKLKFKEPPSGRLGDVLSHLYMTSALLKRYKDEGCPVGDQPPLAWAFHDSVHPTELALSAALRHYPIRTVGWTLHDRKTVVPRQSVSVRVNPGGRRIITNNQTQ